MEAILQQLVSGILIGGVYALFACGLTLTLGVLDILNLAHGITFAWAAIAGAMVAGVVGAPAVALVIFGAGVGAAIGLLLEYAAFRPVRRQGKNDTWSALIASLAMLFILQSVAQVITGARIVSYPIGTIDSRIVSIGDITMRTPTLIMFLVSVSLTVALSYTINRTQFGRAARAVALDTEAAEMMGIDVRKYTAAIICLSGAVAGIAGVLVGVAFGGVHFSMGDAWLLRGFAVIILGGIGSVGGALIGGIVLGAAEGMAILLFASGWRDAIAFGVLMAVLMVKPYGLFGRALVMKS